MRLRLSILIGIIFLLGYIAQAQVVVDNLMSVQQLVEEYLIGDGIQVENITINGQPASTVNNQVGLYSGTSNVIDFDKGVVLVTGDAKVTIEGGFEIEPLTNPIYNDPDLVAMSNQNINDAIIIEFDFMPTGDSIKFNYVFASKEYPNYTCTNYNDAFGFFLSGPGISGPYSNNAKNIALIPGTEIAVSINTVNGGAPTGLSGQASNCFNANPDWIEHSQYFVHNNPPPPGEVKFPGMTQTFTALSAVQCGEWYHIKLAIGDAIDDGFDSGVFLETGSFTTFGEVYLTVVPQIGGSAIVTPPYDSVLVAGCSEAYIELTRPQGIGAGSVHISFGGTAILGDPNFPIPGADYLLGDTDTLFYFPQGVDTLRFTITTLWDGIPDENEYITISIHFQDGCGESKIASTTIYFVDPYKLSSSTETESGVVICPTDKVLLTTQGLDGIEPYIYDWGDYGIGKNLTGVWVDVLPADSTYYQVSISDACAFEHKLDSVLVVNNMSDPLQAMISPFSDPECPNEPVDMHATIKDGNGKYTIVWGDGMGRGFPKEEDITITNTNKTVDFALDETNFTDILPFYLMVIDTCGTIVRDTVYVNYPFIEPLKASFNPLNEHCPTEPITLKANVKNGADEFMYGWSISSGKGKFVDGADITANHIQAVPAGGVNTFTLIVSDNCGRSVTDYQYTVDNKDFRSGSDIYVDKLDVIKLDNIMNVITPNGDNRNDYFAIEGIDGFEDSRLEIYDRWGKMIFSTDNYPAGNIKAAKPVGAFDADGFEDGTYFYVINVNSGECVQSGVIEVLRGNN